MKENYKRKAQKKHEEKVKTDFSKGKVYVLDEETWTWKLEDRGERQ